MHQVFAVADEEADEVDELLQKFSMWKTLRVCKWIKRFIGHCHNHNERKRGLLATEKSRVDEILG